MGAAIDLIKKLIYVSLFQQAITLSASNVTTEFNFSNGYRNDTLKRTNSLQLEPPALSQKDYIKIDNINLWQVGLNTRLMLPPTIRDCHSCPWWLNFFVTGFAYWGIGGGGANLHEKISNLVAAQIGKAKMKSVSTSDYQGGVGYLFEINSWDVTLSAGYAYDRQKIRAKSGEIAFTPLSDFVDAPIYGDGYNTTTTWKGAWVGTEIFYTWSSEMSRLVRLSLGYEFHPVHYTVHHTIPVDALAAEAGMESVTKSSHAYGNVLWLNARHFFFKNWEWGATFTYRYWFAERGHLTSSYFARNGYPPSTTVSATGKWISYAINFDIGYAF